MTNVFLSKKKYKTMNMPNMYLDWPIRSPEPCAQGAGYQPWRVAAACLAKVAERRPRRTGQSARRARGAWVSSRSLYGSKNCCKYLELHVKL